MCSLSDVTDSAGKALPSSEKNSTIEGTIANRIAKIEKNKVFSTDSRIISRNPETVAEDNFAAVYISGGIAIVSINALITIPDEWTRYEIFYGAPSPIGDVYATGTVQCQGNGLSYVVFVNGEGTVLLDSDMFPVESKFFRGSISYRYK